MTTLWVPPDFNPLEFLPDDLATYADYARYIVNLIFRMGIKDKRYEEGEFISLKYDYLAEKFPDTYIYTKIRQALLDNDVIECDGYYIEKEKSYGYRLDKKFDRADFIRIDVATSKLKTKLNKDQRSRIMPNTKKPIHSEIIRNLYRVRINCEDALAELGPDATAMMKGRIRLLHEADIFFHYDEFGRVHHSLSNLKRTMRKHLTVDGEKLANVDVANSQPLIFLLVLFANMGYIPKKRLVPSNQTLHYLVHEAQIDDETLPSDVIVYQNLVERGLFYEFMMEAARKPIDQREAFKEDFYEFFFGTNNPDRFMDRIFRELFPNIYKVVFGIKNPNHREMAHKLQKAESQLIIEKVCPRIVKELPGVWFSTIHDSILTIPTYAPNVREIIKQEFQKIKLDPTVKIEYY